MDSILSVLANADVINSFAEGRRLLANGGIKLNGKREMKNIQVDDHDVISIGKRIFITKGWHSTRKP